MRMLRNPRPAGDEGSILILTTCFSALALVVILLVVAATSLYLERKRLFTLADGAALAGAEAFDLDEVEIVGESGLTAHLQSDDVAEAVDGYLAAQPLGGFEGLAVVQAGTADGLSATVSLSAEWRPPVVSLFVPDGFPISVTSVARSVFY